MLLGLAGSGGAAVAATRGWVDFGGESAGAMAHVASIADQAPVPGALALVALAGFGTLLVTRGRVRRFLAVVTAAASAAVVLAVVLAAPRLLDQARVGFSSVGADPAGLALNAWVYLSAAAGTLSLLAALAAWRWAPEWPEMGRRYDAPQGRRTEEPRNPEDWWRALDAGEDPSDR